MREYGRALLAYEVALLMGSPELIALALRRIDQTRPAVVEAMPWWARS